ncbi:MAG: prepilin-type N-terminal cleavage/methylation domain-containing protein [Thermoleophilia bacterium]|nr:prepilin-type N-terminal cleavage/methylation domain-containing protein [Thermoleophilia bacterium]
MPRHKAKHRGRAGLRGFTLIEVLIASMLLLIVMAGIVPFFVGGLAQASTVRYKSLATNIARERMEQIRQLDYREITENPAEGTTLSARFGTTAERRGIKFNISYKVESSTYDTGLLKKVTVTVSWTAPPRVSPASITTLIHQQFLGPRGAYLELSPTQSDPLGTPFPLIAGSSTRIRYHIAEADWGLVFRDVTKPSTTARDVFARFFFVGSDGRTIFLGDPDDENRIDTAYLRYSTSGSQLTDVWFEYSFDTRLIPDGYWELRAVAYNEYEQPGNVWRLRVRIENGAPAAPTQFTAVAQPDNQSVVLYWLGGPESDRDHYVLERSVWNSQAQQWTSWQPVAPNIAPDTVTYTDQGSVALKVHPWGSQETTNWYLYRIYAVDRQPGNIGPAAALTQPVVIPPMTTTTTTQTTTTVSTTSTTTISTTTTTLATYSVKVQNNAKSHYRVDVRNASNALVYTGTVKKGQTLTISGLPAGQYKIDATPISGGSIVSASFSLPAQADQIVLTLL